jgi:hypothetical protein
MLGIAIVTMLPASARAQPMGRVDVSIATTVGRSSMSGSATRGRSTMRRIPRPSTGLKSSTR